MVEVRKRDGRVVHFDKNKIINAIMLAMKSVSMIDKDLANSIAEKISSKVNSNTSVAEIEKMVENKLMNSKYKDVAREYIGYRRERTKRRRLDKDLYKKAERILKCREITNDNANVDQYSFSGRENRVGEELHKQIAEDSLLREKVFNAFKQNRIYLHDFSKYSTGMHNCSFTDMKKLLENGFDTRNGDVRGANSISSAFQLCAVIFQCQSQVQFGGVGSCHIDTDLAPYVKISFKKHFNNGLKYIGRYSEDDIEKIFKETKIELDNKKYLSSIYPREFEYAYDMLYKEGSQGSQALFHNLNTLESRSGSQVPFTSQNFGRDTSIEGRLVTEWLLHASLEGIGKLNKTSIFPISIMQYKKGINDKPQTPNYDLKKLAIKSMTKRIYPNWVNCDFTNHKENLDNPDTYMATMGCRTMLGYDRFTGEYTKMGRGNLAPTTIILPKLGIEYGIALGKRKEADIEGFWSALEETLEITKISLLDRFAHIANQSPKSAPFMYQNGTMIDGEKCEDNVYETMKHNTLAIGYIGVAEMCQALFGMDHSDSEDVKEFALSVIKRIYDFVQESSDKHNLNFSTYATPAEGLCLTAMSKLKNEYGEIPNVTERDYLTNSHHVPVWKKISIFDKIDVEAPFCYYATGGCITYIELDSSIINNEKAVEQIIDYAMDKNIPYLAFNFPLDTCLDCGYQGEFNDKCSACHSSNIQQLRRVTGYITSDFHNFNKGKISECLDREKHSQHTNFNKEVEEDE